MITDYKYLYTFDTNLFDLPLIFSFNIVHLKLKIMMAFIEQLDSQDEIETDRRMKNKEFILGRAVEQFSN